MSNICAHAIRKGLAGIILSCLLCTNVDTQVAGGTLRGLVSDPTGAVVPGAEVTIRNLATAVTAKVSTDRTGAYSLPRLSHLASIQSPLTRPVSNPNSEWS
jgi:hypothetical protein